MQPNVLFLMVDAFRADRCWGPERRCRTPVLDDLRHRSTVFINAFSTASMTTCCTSSILTGSYPFVHGVRSLADRRLRSDIPTLAETFKTHGYHTWAEVSGPLLPTTRLNRGFDDYRHREHTQWLDTPWGDDLIAKVKGDRPRPWFGFVHLWEIHHPRRATLEYNRPEYGQNLYERAVSSLDHQLGRLLEALPEDTLLVLTGDHGEYVSTSESGDIVGRLKRPLKWLKRRLPGGWKLRRISPMVFKGMDRFGQRDNEFYFNWLGHGFHVYDYLVHIPLIMYGPGLFPSQVEISHLVSHVDIFPTLVSALDLREANTSLVSGMDLMPIVRAPDHPRDGRPIYMEASGGRVMPRPEQWLAGLRTERYKYVRGLFNEALPEELYDLEKDPGERENVVGQFPDVAATMRARFSAVLQSSPEPHLESETAYSPEEQAQLTERLRDLGYL